MQPERVADLSNRFRVVQSVDVDPVNPSGAGQIANASDFIDCFLG